MGNASSKAGKTAAAATKRKYPQQASPATTNNPSRPPAGGYSSARGPAVHSQPLSSSVRDECTSQLEEPEDFLLTLLEAINLDSSDPQFAASLRSLGPVTPSSTLSNSSHFASSSSSAPSTITSNSPQSVFPDLSQNPAIQVLTARGNLAKEAEAEFARVRYEGGGGRKFLDVMTIRQILMFRDEKNLASPEIEKKLGLAPGTVAKLGPKRVVGEAGMALG